MHYGHIERLTRHPSGCLCFDSYLGRRAICQLSSSIEPTGQLRSSTYLWTKQVNIDFSSCKNYKSEGVTRRKMRRFTKKRPMLFTTGTSKDEPSTLTKRFGYITLALSFSQVSCAHVGTVRTWLWNCLTTDQCLFPILNLANNSR